MPELGRVIATPYKIRIMGQERQLGIVAGADAKPASSFYMRVPFYE